MDFLAEGACGRWGLAWSLARSQSIKLATVQSLSNLIAFTVADCGSTLTPIQTCLPPGDFRVFAKGKFFQNLGIELSQPVANCPLSLCVRFGTGQAAY